MKKELRIKKSDEIERVMKKGFSKANRTFIVYKYQNGNNNNYRIAISASKKLGNAVTRNLIKRQMRAALKQNDDILENGYDYFIIARPNMLEIDFIQINKQLKHVFKLFSQPTQQRKKSSNQK